MPAIDDLKKRLADFATERNWHQFHTPKSLSMALTGEAAELMEHFQWVKDDESTNLSPEQREAVEMEMADVFLYLLLLANKLDVDILTCAEKKIAINAAKYPVDKAYGTAKKYTDFD